MDIKQEIRNVIKKGLSQCTDRQQEIFKRMYSHDDLSKPIDEVVDSMLEENLLWAASQIQRTLDKA